MAFKMKYSKNGFPYKSPLKDDDDKVSTEDLPVYKGDLGPTMGSAPNPIKAGINLFNITKKITKPIADATVKGLKTKAKTSNVYSGRKI